MERAASLDLARHHPGSIVLQSLKAFCFCGTLDSIINTNSIESLQIDADREWQFLPLNDEIRKTQQIAAVAFMGSVFVFGGFS